MVVLTIEHLAVTYGSGVQAVRDATLSVREGEFVALLGANGAGKTTLLRALSGLLSHHNGRITAGRAVAFDKDLQSLPGYKRAELGVAQTFEGRRILKDFTVEENLLAGGLSVARDQLGDRIRKIYADLPILFHRKHQPAGLLSGGEQQLLAIARALVSEPKILLLDEPSLGLAPVMIRHIADVMQTIRKSGRTVLLVEQNAHLALDLADRAYVMQHGAIVAEGEATIFRSQEFMKTFYVGQPDKLPPVRRRLGVV
ncbi:ABC transporter ATP-binding protein [Bradyrhizobium sp. 14AA]